MALSDIDCTIYCSVFPSSMMRNRAPGEDDVVAELIKYGRPTKVEAMYKVIVMVWEKKIMPEC